MQHLIRLNNKLKTAKQKKKKEIIYIVIVIAIATGVWNAIWMKN